MNVEVENVVVETGWLNILVFDKDYNLVDAAYDQLHGADGLTVGSSTEGPHQLLKKQVTITKPGFVYIYVSNERVNQQDIYFDDFKYTHSRGPVIQADDYYPFGLTFDSYRRDNNMANQYLCNSKALQHELNLGLHDYIARQYAPELGRFTGVDPAADLMRRVSPHAYSFNNQIRFADPDGMMPDDMVDKDRQRDNYIGCAGPAVRGEKEPEMYLKFCSSGRNFCQKTLWWLAKFY